VQQITVTLTYKNVNSPTVNEQVWGTGGMTVMLEYQIGQNLSQHHSVHHISGSSPASANVLILLLMWLVLKLLAPVPLF
jgi:hypothetical protein